MGVHVLLNLRRRSYRSAPFVPDIEDLFNQVDVKR